jgi:hypothetical protein
MALSSAWNQFLLRMAADLQGAWSSQSLHKQISELQNKKESSPRTVG